MSTSWKVSRLELEDHLLDTRILLFHVIEYGYIYL
jgi:hypothetical protein